MPRMHCMGTSVEIPDNGKICPKLPTNMVPSGTKCEIVCDSGSPNIEYIKCETEGWTSTDVACKGTPAGLIVGLLVGGIVVIIIIAYIYAKMKAKKKKGKTTVAGNKSQPLSRAAKIAAQNDMMVTGVASAEAVKAGMAKSAAGRKPHGKLVSGAPEESEYRHPSSSSQMSNPPSYHSNDPNDERNRNSTSTGKSNRGRRSRTSNGEYLPPIERKPRPHYDEYREEVELGYREALPAPVLDGQYHTTQDNGPMQPDYYGTGMQHGHNRYGAPDHNYYSHAASGYPDQYFVANMENMAHGQAGRYEKPFRVPI